VAEETSLSHKIRNYTVANHSYSEDAKGILIIDGVPLKGATAGRRFFIDVLKASRKNLMKIDNDLALKDEKEMQSDLKDYMPMAIDLLLKDVKAEYIASKISTVGEPTSLDHVMNLVPVWDARDKKGGARMVSKDTLTYVPFEHKTWLNMMPPKHIAACKEQNLYGEFEYNPRLTEAYKLEERADGPIRVYNTYKAPMHLLNRKRDVKIDPRFLKFFNTFFVTEASRIYAENWIYNSLFNKLETYLVLVGAGGTGKNLLAEGIKQLHGKDNFNKASITCLDSRFNGHLMNCTLNYYDECKFSSDKDGNSPRKNRLKDWANAYVAVETKGVDSRDSDIFASSIISTNNDSDLYIEQNDRKFSIMDITDERLEKRLGIEDANWIWKYILTEEFRHGWMNHLEDTVDLNFDTHKEYHGPKFDKLVLTSLSNWKTQLLEEYILTKEAASYSFKMLSDNIPYMPRSVAKVNDFLRSFKYEGKDLGEVVKIDGYNHVKVSKHFAPEDSDTDLLERR